MKKQKSFDTKFKIRVVLETLKNEKTMTQIASENKTSPKNIINWRKHILENLDSLFENNRAVSDYKERLAKAEREKDNLHRKIGELAIENEWLKKKSTECGLL